MKFQQLLTNSLHKKYFLRLGYIFFFVFFFILFFYLTFPYPQLKDYIIHTIKFPKNDKGVPHPSGIDLTIQTLYPSGINGFKAKQVHVTKIEGEANNQKRLEADFNEIHFHANIVKWLQEILAFSFKIHTKKNGFIQGTVEYENQSNTKSIDLDIHISDLPLTSFYYLEGILPLPIQGVINGHIQINKKMDMDVNLKMKDTIIGNTTSKLTIAGFSGLTIEPIHVGHVNFVLTGKNGTANLKKFQIRGKDMNLDGTGTIKAKSYTNVHIDTLLRFNFSESYKNRNQHTQSMFAFLEMNPNIAKAKKEGSLQYHISGSVQSKLDIKPAPHATIAIK